MSISEQTLVKLSNYATYVSILLQSKTLQKAINRPLIIWLLVLILLDLILRLVSGTKVWF